MVTVLNLATTTPLLTMKITDPSLCPDEFAPLTFEYLDDDPRGPEVFSLTVDGTPVGELAPLTFNHLEMLVLDDYETCVLPPDGCWSLELADVDGRLNGTHVLFAGEREAISSEPLSTELAAWATLIVIWEQAGRARQRG